MDTTRTITYTELEGGDVLADNGDVVLMATWGRSLSRALVVEVQHADGTTGRRYFAHDAAIQLTLTEKDT